MERGRGCWAAWLCAALVLLGLPGRAPAQPAALPDTLVFFGDRDLAPYEFLDGGQPRGASVDLIHALGQRMGRKVEIRLLDWAESQRRLLAGEGQALTLMARSPEREARFAFSRPTLPMSLSLFVRTNEAAGFDTRSLAGRRIGVTAAGAPRILLSRERPQAELVVIADLESGTQALLRGEIDAVAAVTWVELHLLHRLGLGGVTPLPPFLHLQPSVAVRRGETALLAEIDRALVALESSGEVERIIDRWSAQRIYTFTGLTVRMGWIAVGIAVLALAGLAVSVVLLRRQRTRLAQEVGVRERAETAAEIRAGEARTLQRMAMALAAATTPDEIGAEFARVVALLPTLPRMLLAKPHRERPEWRVLARSAEPAESAESADSASSVERAPAPGAIAPASAAELALFDAAVADGVVFADRAAVISALLPPSAAPPSLDGLRGQWFYVAALHAAAGRADVPPLGVLVLSWDAPPMAEGAGAARAMRESLDSVAALLTQALERALVHRAERRAAAQQAALRQAAASLATAADPAAVCRVVAEVAREHRAGARTAIALFDLPLEAGQAPAAGAMLSIVADPPLPDALAPKYRRVGADAGLAITIAAGQARSLYLGSRATLGAATAACCEWPAGNPVPALVALPLQAPATTDASLAGRSSRLGAVVIAFEEPQRFDGEDRAFLESLAGMAARAIERCQLLERLQSSLARSEEAGLKTRLALEANGMGTWDLEIDTQQLEWSRRMYALLGLPPGPGREPAARFFERLHPDDAQAVREAIDRAVADGGDFEASFRVQAEHGQTRWLMGRGRVLQRRGAGPARLLGVCFDITPMMRARHELEAADRNKDEFLAMVSHELRNPLGPILNAATMLERAGDRAEIRAKAVPLIQRQIRQMGHLIDDLLELSRVRHGRIALNRVPVDAAAAVHEALESVRPLIDRQGHQVELRPAAQALLIDADRARLIQMLANLLGNAAKYTPPGGRIEIDIERAGAQAVLRISDNGVGIAPEFLPRLFDLFTQDRQSLARSEGGLGLGLALVKRLAELHGGSIEVASAGRGLGSCFSLRLPLAAGA